jgi:hypothetical protein
MRHFRPVNRRSDVVFFSLLILFGISAAPDRRWAKTPAITQWQRVNGGLGRDSIGP